MVYLAQLQAVAQAASKLDDIAEIRSAFQADIALELQKADVLGLGAKTTDNLNDLLVRAESIGSEADLAGLRIRLDHARRRIKDAENLVEHELGFRNRGDSYTYRADQVAAKRRFDFRGYVGAEGISTNRFGQLRPEGLRRVNSQYQAIKNADVIVTLKPLAPGQNSYLFDSANSGKKTQRAAFIDPNNLNEGIIKFFEDLKADSGSVTDIVIHLSEQYHIDEVLRARIYRLADQSGFTVRIL